jgi:hypothetical protein
MTVLLVADVAVVYGWVAPLAVAVDPDQPAAEPVPVEVTLVGGAVVTFPTMPQDSTQVLRIAGSDALLRLHSAQTADGATYNMGVIDYPPQVNLSDPAQNLIASVSGAAGNVGGRVVEQEVTLYRGAPAVEFLVEAQDVRLRARHVLEGRRLYAQNVAYRGLTEPPDAAAFFRSLRLRVPADPSDSPAPDASAPATPGFEPTPGDL